jgi:hypothetical protein
MCGGGGGEIMRKGESRGTVQYLYQNWGVAECGVAQKRKRTYHKRQSLHVVRRRLKKEKND